MFWDGSKWIDHAAPTTRDREGQRARVPGRVRDLIATGIMAVALIGLVVPNVQVEASPARLSASWGGAYKVASYQEKSRRIKYVGQWILAVHPRYYGDHARFSNTRASSATFSFTGSAVAWIGPVGPTRGKAAVYIDGTFVTTVDTYAGTYDPTRVLFRKNFGSMGSHTLRIEVVGTPGHPTVAIDKFVVRGTLKANPVRGSSGNAVPKQGEPTATPTAEPTATPTAEPTATPTAEPTATPTAEPTATPTAEPTAAPTARPASTTAPTSAPTPAPAATDRSVRVSSIAGLLSALADNSLDEIVVANGTYHVDVAYKQAAKSLYIGSRFAGRTRAITIRAETSGRVTFDGGNAAGGMGLWFGQGAHDQTWEGFNFANIVGTPVEFGGFTPSAPAHHITMRHITLMASCHRASASSNQEQGFYFSNAKGTGPHDILLADIDIDGSSPLSVWSGIHGYHGDAANPPPSNITIRRLNVVGTTNAIVLWYDSGTQRNWTFEDVTINGARANAIRFESVGAKTILFDNVISRGSGESGFYSSMGAHPPGVTITNSSLR